MYLHFRFIGREGGGASFNDDRQRQQKRKESDYDDSSRPMKYQRPEEGRDIKTETNDTRNDYDNKRSYRDDGQEGSKRPRHNEEDEHERTSDRNAPISDENRGRRLLVRYPHQNLLSYFLYYRKKLVGKEQV